MLSNNGSLTDVLTVLVSCDKYNTPVRNTSVGSVNVLVQTNFSDKTFVLDCSLLVHAGELPKNQKLFIKCQNVDIGVTVADSFEIAGIHTKL